MWKDDIDEFTWLNFRQITKLQELEQEMQRIMYQTQLLKARQFDPCQMAG